MERHAPTARILASLIVFLPACSPNPGEGQGEVAPPPEVVQGPVKVDNVVLITIDTLRADYLGSHGGPARTPVLDDLAGGGWHFEDCISSSMLTNPSHASIMTSLYPRDHGVLDNESGIKDGMSTIATAMKRAGRQTGAIINFPHLNPSVSNLGQGFDRVTRATRNERRADEISKLGLAMIDRLEQVRVGEGDRGFFTWLHYTDPHAPYEPPATHPPREQVGSDRTPIKQVVKAAPGFQRKNPWFKKAFRRFAHAEDLVERYVAEIEATDAGLGILIAGLEERGMLDRTAIIITSDHGENMGEHNLWFHHGGLYRPSVHVPLIVSAPGIVPRRFTGQVATVDIAPTILEITDAPRWEPMRGRSLMGLARGTDPGRDFVFSEHMLSQQVAARSKDGTFILHRKTTGQFPSYRMTSGSMELYDRRSDPGENTPLSVENPLADRLEAAVDRYLGLGLQLSARRPLEQDRESLRALGYIE